MLKSSYYGLGLWWWDLWDGPKGYFVKEESWHVRLTHEEVYHLLMIRFDGGTDMQKSLTCSMKLERFFDLWVMLSVMGST
jgi:hypothetical protein